MKHILQWVMSVLLAFSCINISQQSAIAADNLLVNGSFEKPAVQLLGYPESIPGWQLGAGPAVEFQQGIAGNPYDGGQLVELDGLEVSSIYQNIPTKTGTNYKLTFAFSPRPDVADNKLNVSWGDTKVVQLNKSGEGLTDTDWQVYTYILKATGNTTRLSFDDLDETSDGLGSYIDAVSVTEATIIEASETPVEIVWYSGAANSKYHMDFSKEPPVITCGSPVGQSPGFEGTANFTDPKTGKLKLYTDGQKVFNGQSNALLANGTGLKGNPTAGEAAMIVPVPGTERNQFYIFSNEGGSVFYSIADLGKGDNGTITVKNQPLATKTGEALGIAPHENGTDFWVLVFNTGSQVDAYKVDKSGIISSPVSSNTGFPASLGRASIITSPDFNALSLGWAGYRIATASIDRSTGVISNFTQRVTGQVGYSTAFSPDGTKLYYADGYQGYGGTPWQLDLTTGTKTKLNPKTGFGGPKLAPDGKIYWTVYNGGSLSSVNNPNAAGSAANFALNSLNLKGCKGSYNLPNQTSAALVQLR